MKRSSENTDDPEAQEAAYEDIDNWLVHDMTLFLIIDILL